MLVPLWILAVVLLGQDDPPARELSRILASEPRLAGTAGGERAARFVADVLRAAGFTIVFDRREVLLTFPRRIDLEGFAGETPLFGRIETFDPRADDPGDVPKYNAYGKSATIAGPVVDVGRGLRADYERLAAEGVVVEGKIALARYGGSYRGVKADLAQEFGCLGVLLFNDPAEDGALQGEVWPEGRWKPGWDAQRGSIAPLARCPGDPSTPGWPSPRPGEKSQRAKDTDARLPGIPCLPVGADEALALIEASDPRVSLTLDNPRELFPIVSVIATLAGTGEDLVIAGNHRDAWVRGAHDAGSGTVALMRAGQRLGERVKHGWKPGNDIVLAFWDGEEFGLIGSTEWGETHATNLREHALAYVNADAVVSGLQFRASGTPGLLGTLQRALERIPAPPLETDLALADEAGTLWDQWSTGSAPALSLPGSGSDYTVFLHHLGVPVLDLGFGGNSGGQYHTTFDDFEFMDRYLDPTWQGHETAGLLVAELLAEIADTGRASFDEAEAARGMAAMVRATSEQEDWAQLERLELAFAALAEAIELDARLDTPLEEKLDRRPSIYRHLQLDKGLPDRPWYKNPLWAPGLETGYAAETLPTLRLAAGEGDEAFARELDALVARVEELTAAWRTTPPDTGQ